MAKETTLLIFSLAPEIQKTRNKETKRGERRARQGVPLLIERGACSEHSPDLLQAFSKLAPSVFHPYPRLLRARNKASGNDQRTRLQTITNSAASLLKAFLKACSKLAQSLPKVFLKLAPSFLEACSELASRSSTLAPEQINENTWEGPKTIEASKSLQACFKLTLARQSKTARPTL